jgi:Tol biopolymer transport system component/predicted Ser/Thr protein kinase
MPLSTGTLLGPYQILAPIGAGGMGEVYSARDTRLDRFVALKVSRTDFSERFDREARAVASLNHPNICVLYDVGPNYLVMELVVGEPLKGPLPLEKAIEYALQILDALDAAHKKGITHRDLKPANILVTKQGVKLLDFGLAKQAAPLKEYDATLTEALTSKGQIVGTLQYMSPEQLQGKDADARSDLFAFGCVLYELISGKQAFAGESAASVIAAILEREPSPLDTLLPLDRVIRTCLAKDPDQRFQNALDLKRALSWAMEQQSSAPNTRRPMLPWIAAACLAVVAVVALWALWRMPPVEGNRPMVQLDLDVGDEVSQPAISPDGQRVVFVANGHLAVRHMDQAQITTLSGTEGASHPFFSPDGQWVAFFAGGKLQKIALQGGAPVRLCDAIAGRGGAWGEDGYIIASLDPIGGLVKVPASGGTPLALTDLKGELPGVTSHRWPQVLPGRKGVLFAATAAGSMQGSLRVLPPGGGKAKTVVQNSAYGRYAAGGYLVYYQQGTLFIAPTDMNRLELRGTAVPLVDGVASDAAVGADFDVSSSGTLVYRKGPAGTNRVVSWLDSAGRTEPILAKPGSYWTPRLAPDGKRLALSVEQDGQRNLWIYDFTRKTLTRLTFDSESQISPIWTPEGDFLAFNSGDTLAWVRADGSGSVERLLSVNRSPFAWSFSPDGKRLAFNRNDPMGGAHLWAVSVERAPGALRLGEPRPLLRQAHEQMTPAISADGRWMAYTSDESGAYEVYVVPFSSQGPARDGKWQISNAGGRWPLWSRNSRELFYQSLDQRVMAAAYTATAISFGAEKPHVWAEKRLAGTGALPTFDVALDGKRVLAIFEAKEAKPETHLRVLLNVGDALRQRAPAGDK